MFPVTGLRVRVPSEEAKAEVRLHSLISEIIDNLGTPYFNDAAGLERYNVYLECIRDEYTRMKEDVNKEAVGLALHPLIFTSTNNESLIWQIVNLVDHDDSRKISDQVVMLLHLLLTHWRSTSKQEALRKRVEEKSEHLDRVLLGQLLPPHISCTLV